MGLEISSPLPNERNDVQLSLPKISPSVLHLGEWFFHILLSIWILKFMLIRIWIEQNPCWCYTSKPSFGLLGVKSLFHEHFLLWTMSINLLWPSTIMEMHYLFSTCYPPYFNSKKTKGKKMIITYNTSFGKKYIKCDVEIEHLELLNAYLGADELKRAKIDVKMSTFLQFMLHLSMWCHFNGMGIMKSCTYGRIWILKKIKWVKINSFFSILCLSKFKVFKKFMSPL